MKAYIRLFLVFLLISIGGGTIVADTSVLVEEGRTWWYHYWYREKDKVSPQRDREDFGLSLSGSETYDGKEWQKCMVVNRDGDPILDFPIALLRQDGDKVYVAPRVTASSEWDRIERLPARFGEVYGRFLCFVVDDECSYFEEYLLYDWEMQPGDTLYYPWVMEFPTIDKIVTIMSSQMEDGRMTWRGIWGWNDVCLIVEGLGGVATSDYQCGAFVYPCMYRQVTTGMMGDPTELFLDKVTDKAGDVVWSSTSGVETIKVDKVMAEDAIYDLYGRRVYNPQPGSIYIRGGRKFVGH